VARRRRRTRTPPTRYIPVHPSSYPPPRVSLNRAADGAPDTRNLYNNKNIIIIMFPRWVENDDHRCRRRLWLYNKYIMLCIPRSRHSLLSNIYITYPRSTFYFLRKLFPSDILINVTSYTITWHAIQIPENEFDVWVYYHNIMFRPFRARFD